MDARTLSIKTIFGQDRWHIVPLFQRPYVWKQDEQWEPLWDDIRKVADRVVSGQDVRAHFLGAIVLEHLYRPMGHIDTRQIIDGQQRLTTIQIILEAFCDCCRTLKADRHYKSLLKLTRNEDPMSEDVDEQYKVWPTNVDREHFKRVMDCESPDELRAYYNVKADAQVIGRPIADGYLYFHKAILEWLKPDQPDYDTRLDALLFTIRDHLRMVVIDLDKEDDPQLIFETLNARGTPLLPSDLVKNYLFHKAIQEHQDIGSLYEVTWKPFDANSVYWRALVGRGYFQRARLDVFLQHYLTAQLLDEVALPHLYTEFCGYAEGVGSAKETLKSVRRHADIYQGFDSAVPGSRAQQFFQRLALLDIGTAYPFMLALYGRYASDMKQIEAVMNDLESFLVRRMVCQLTARGYNTLFLSLMKTLNEGNGTPYQRIHDLLRSGDAESTRWPDNDEFGQAWLKVPAYRLFTRGRVRMLLEALERQYRTDLSENIEIKETLTIEHIMPQSWEAYWPLSVSGDEDRAAAKLRRNEILHTMGNLTLLTKGLNPTVSNSAWATKLDALKKHSALALNRNLSQSMAQWDESTIEQRGKELFAFACKIWPYPAK